VDAHRAAEWARRDEELPPFKGGTDLPAGAGFASSVHTTAQWGRGGLLLQFFFKKAAAKKSPAVAFKAFPAFKSF
jgi:hypothetical protein